MPGRDGTGPVGFGKDTRNGLGFCSGARNGKVRQGAFFGRQCGLGFGKAELFDPIEMDQRELLVAQQKALENRLNAINEQLHSL